MLLCYLKNAIKNFDLVDFTEYDKKRSDWNKNRIKIVIDHSRSRGKNLEKNSLVVHFVITSFNKKAT